MPYLLLLGIYTFFRLPDLLAVKELSCMIFPLDSIYIAKQLLFSGWHVNPDLANTVVAPSNATFIAPPGLYIISKIMGSVRNDYVFLFIFQLLVPIVTFRLLKYVVPFRTAFLATVIACYYFTCGYWWAADWVIQPLMLMAVLILVRKGKSGKLSTADLIYIGILTGLIMIFKHNIGIMFTIGILTWLLMNSLDLRPKDKGNLGALLFFGVIYLCFGMAIGTKLIHHDEYLFYLFSYFLFWGVFIYYCFKTPCLQLNFGKLIKNSLIFLGSLFILPAVVFFIVGREVGFSRYAHSFFMGLGYAKIWEPSYFEIIRSYCHFSGINKIYASLVHVCLFLLPLMVNMAVVWRFARLAQNAKTPFADIKQFLQIAPLAIMGIFLFYPLEGYHILATKMFIFIFVLFYLCKNVNQKLISAVLCILIIPLILFGAMSLAGCLRHSMPAENPLRLKAMIGISMKSDIAEGIVKETEVMERSIKGSSYYLIGSDSLDLSHLLAIVDNPYKQYYIEMRKGVLRTETVNAVIQALKDVEYAVVETEDYKKYLNSQNEDIFLRTILDVIHKNFIEVDRFEVPAGIAGGAEFHSFLVMKKAIFRNLK